MPLLDVRQLKKQHGQRKRVVLDSLLPDLVLDDQVVKIPTPAHLELTLTNIGAGIAVDGSITVQFPVQCHSCLNQFTISLQLDFLETYYDQEQLAGNIEEDQTTYIGDQIDITPEVMDATYLNLPMRFICANDCQGLCQFCGTNLNVKQCQCQKQQLDPRLAKLKNLL